MLQKEFFDRTKITLTPEEYNAVDAMYNNCGNLDKDQFCKDWVKHHDSVILSTFYNEVCRQADKIKMLEDELSEFAEFLVLQAQETESRSIRAKAIKLMGLKKFLSYKISKGYTLWTEDNDDLVSILNN